MEKVILDPKVKKNFGFGCMRLPMQGKEVDLTEFTKMVDAFLAAGFNYFDTAHGYLEGKSETALKACLTSRYSREEYVLTDKLSNNFLTRRRTSAPSSRVSFKRAAWSTSTSISCTRRIATILKNTNAAAPTRRRLPSKQKGRCAAPDSPSTTKRKFWSASSRPIPKWTRADPVQLCGL